MATGDTLATFEAISAQSPLTGYPQLDSRNGHWVLDFDDTADESTIFSGLLPQNYAGGDIEVVISWAATTAVIGDVKWEASIERVYAAGGDLDVDAFGTASSAAETTSGTSGRVTQTSLSILAADAGSPVAGDGFRVKVTRRPTDGADTLVGDAEILFVEIREA